MRAANLRTKTKSRSNDAPTQKRAVRWGLEPGVRQGPLGGAACTKENTSRLGFVPGAHFLGGNQRRLNSAKRSHGRRTRRQAARTEAGW